MVMFVTENRSNLCNVCTNYQHGLKVPQFVLVDLE